MTEHTKPETIEESLLQVSEPARDYYRKWAPFTRGYNLAFHKFDFEPFNKDLPVIFELAKVGLITWINVTPVHPCDDYGQIRERMMEAAASQEG